MAKPKKVTNEEVKKASDDATEVKAAPSEDFQKDLVAQMAKFEERMNLLQEENRLLNEQVQLQSQKGKDPLAYAKGEQSKPVEAPNVLPSFSEKLLRAMEEDDKIVEGKFEFKEITRPKEAKDSTVTFVYRKYPGKPVQTYTLQHNHVYQLPLGVAKHINGALGGCKYAIHKHVMDEKTGEQRIDSGQEVHRMGFHSTQLI